jgi:paraquat-inducible protein A
MRMGSTAIRPVLLIAAPFLLALGLVLPLIRFEKLYFFDESPSLVAIIAGLWSGDDYLLAAVVSLVSVIFPVFKLIGLAAETAGQESSRFYRRAAPHLSRWSMMDVLLVAIVIAAAKTTGIADAFSQPGLWCYAGSTIVSGLLHSLNGNKEDPK